MTTEIETTILGNSLQDYAPISWTFAKALYDLTGEPCAMLEAIIESEGMVRQ